MEQLQMATLTLHTCTLQPDAITAKGSVNNFNTVTTWNNINFRLLLGDMYDKYDLFNIRLVSIACDDNRIGELVSGNSASDRIVTVNMSGLNFYNQTYDSSTNINTSKTVIATYKLYESFATFYTNHIATFGKGNDVCNLTIEFNRISDNQPVNCAASLDYPQMVFLFNIYGIPRVERK